MFDDLGPGSVRVLEMRELREASEESALAPFALAGNVTTEKHSKAGIGVVQLLIAERNQCFRAPTAMGVEAGETVAGAEWIEVRGNISLRRLLAQYGGDLLGYDAARRDILIEVLSLEVFESETRSVRVLIRSRSVDSGDQLSA